MWKLTSEGRKYLSEGLPERRLLKVLKERPHRMEELVNHPDSSIAIQWAKKNGWIEVTNGEVSLTRAGSKAINENDPLHGAINEIERNGRASEEILRIIVTRKLATEELTRAEIAQITQLTPDMLKSGAWKTAGFRQYDPTAPAPVIHPGKKQAYRAFLDEVREELVALGFEEMTGPLVELAFYDLDALFVPQDHTARGVHDIYYVKDPKYGGIPKIHSGFLPKIRAAHENGGSTGSTGWRVPFSDRESARLLLRSHGTSLSARWLMKENIRSPGAYFAIARTFRPDRMDATHMPEFNQLEGIVLDEHGNFRKILGLLSEFAKRIAGTDKVKFRPAYFPFTEPSVQGMVWHPGIKKWLEMLPAGMFRPELTAPLGIKVPVMAWGIGIDRLFMIRENITDIRQLFSQDIDWLRNQEVS
ncbi:MAG: phenylalanine--tRNA ligase subunit alpha [Candidatus Aenigmatarchaeota archaeon]